VTWRPSTIEAAHLIEHVRVLVGILARVVDQTANGLAGIGKAMLRGHRLEKLDLPRLQINRQRLRIFHIHSEGFAFGFRKRLEPARSTGVPQ